MSIILSLETSCDESAAALVSDEKGKIHLIGNEIASQIEEHANWGGVVPEIVSGRVLDAPRTWERENWVKLDRKERMEIVWSPSLRRESLV